VFFIPVQSANRRFIGPGGVGGGVLGRHGTRPHSSQSPSHPSACFAENSPDVPVLLVPRQAADTSRCFNKSDWTVNPLPAPGRSQ